MTLKKISFAVIIVVGQLLAKKTPTPPQTKQQEKIQKEISSIDAEKIALKAMNALKKNQLIKNELIKNLISQNKPQRYTPRDLERFKEILIIMAMQEATKQNDVTKAVNSVIERIIAEQNQIELVIKLFQANQKNSMKFYIPILCAFSGASYVGHKIFQHQKEEASVTEAQHIQAEVHEVALTHPRKTSSRSQNVKTKEQSDSKAGSDYSDKESESSEEEPTVSDFLRLVRGQAPIRSEKNHNDKPPSTAKALPKRRQTSQQEFSHV